jgi:hypothetical protein
MNKPVCNNLINSGAASGPLFSYKHPLNQVGNVMSISAVAGWNGRLVYGDFTTGQIFSLAPDGSDQRLIQGDSSECADARRLQRLPEETDGWDAANTA